ncbi:hypothetical protein CDL12_08434 [Handroanthus impetiginosus]|uniref:RING-type domain-containing protein n=1 Tax=Handroanthus impetiginosus TaxID=429701 RepID=A0A2G9HMY0_9LAMI|nr:hypothetical protein CDL12_08434 [Handroanthus impetiginosus]
MSGSSRNRENWQRGQDYWIYLPQNLADNYVPPTTSLNPRGRTRDPLWLLEERSTRVPTYGLARFPVSPGPRPSARFLLIDDYDPYLSPTPIDTPPTYYQPPFENYNSVLSQEDQNKALNKLRKQYYNPHISNIVKRLGTKSTTTGGGSFKSAADDFDDGKRCAVCLDDLESNKFVTVTPCNHMFHEECIVPWVKSQGKCPVCRYVIA